MLELKKLIEGTVPFVPFSVSIDAEGLADDASSGIINAEGKIINHSGYITLHGVVKPEFKTVCARCGKEFVYSDLFEINAKLTEELANKDEDEFIIIEDHHIDIEEFVRSEAILELPSRFLCKVDCKGICAKCGCDLNIASCSCDNSEHDPRWDALSDYFKE